MRARALKLGGYRPHDFWRIARTNVLFCLFLATLAVFPVFALLHQAHLFQNFQQAYFGLIKTVSPTHLDVQLGKFAEEVRLELDVAREPAGTKLSAGNSQVKIVPAYEVPSSRFADFSSVQDRCRVRVDYGGVPAAFGCAAVVLRPEDSTGDLVEQVKSALQGSRIPDILESHYEAMQKPEVEQQATSPRFIYVVVSLKGHETLLIYPATFISNSYDFTKREWYRDTEAVGGLDITRPYYDYVTGDLTVSLSKRIDGRFSSDRCVVDILLPDFERNLAAAVINSLLAALASFAYFRYFRLDPRDFVKYLAISTAVLLAAWLLILWNTLAPNAHTFVGATFSKWDVASFLPSGAFLLIAARRIQAGRSLRVAVELPVLVLLEVLLAFISLELRTNILSHVFSFLALAAFGLSLLKLKNRLRGMPPREDSFRPTAVNLCRIAAAAYCFWGISQLLLARFPDGMTLVERTLVEFEKKHSWLEYALAEPGSLIILAYLKSTSIAVTIVLLSELKNVQRRRHSLNTQLLFVDRSGVVVNEGTVLTGRTLRGSDLSEIIRGSVHRREFRAALQNDSQEGFICRLPELFGDEWRYLSVEPMVAEDNKRVVVFRRLEIGSLVTEIGDAIYSDFRKLLADAEKVNRELANAVQLDTSFSDQFRHLFRRAESVLGLLGKVRKGFDLDEIMSSSELEARHAWADLEITFAVLGRAGVNTDADDQGLNPARFPSLLQMNRRIWGIALDQLTAILEESFAEIKEAAPDFAIDMLLTARPPVAKHPGVHDHEFVTFTISAEVGSLLGFRLPSLPAGPDSARIFAEDPEIRNAGRLQLATDLVRMFEGDIQLTSDGDGNNHRIDIKVRYYRSDDDA